MGFWNRSRSQQRQTQTAAGQGRGGGQTGRGAAQAKAAPAAKAKAKGKAAPAAPAAQGASDDSIKRSIQEVRHDKLKPLGEMLSHPPNEDMSSLIDMYLGEAHASLEQLQEQIAHSTDDEAMMGLVQLSSEFHDLQEQAENWKQRAAHGGSGHDATPMHSGTPHAGLPSGDLGAHMGESQAGQGHAPTGPGSHPADAGAGGVMSHIREGDGVVVVSEFDAMGETPVRLKLGDRGLVDEIDADGDACIDFEHLDDMQWVSGEDFEHLRVLPADETPSSSRRTPQRGRTPTSSGVHDTQHSALDSAQNPWQQPGHYSAQPDAQHSEQQLGHPGQSQEDADLQAALEASRQQHEQESPWAVVPPPPPPADTWSWREGVHGQVQWPEGSQSQGQANWPDSTPSQAGHSEAPQHAGGSAEQEQRREEAESTLRATLAGAGREDKEMLTFALQEAKDAGVSGAVIEDGDRALRDLEHQEQLDQARQQLQDVLDRPQRDATALQHALAQASAAGLPDADLAPARDALRGINEQEDKLKAVHEASHSRDPNLLRTAIEEARHAGVSESIIKQAEKHLTALQFITRYPEVDRAAMLRGWHELATALRKARQKLKDVLNSGAKAEDVDTAVHHLEEAGGDDTEVADGRRIADARRSAHDQVVCALVTQDPQDLHAAQVALDRAGGPEADREHLQPALSAVDHDNLLLRDLDLVLPGAVQKYLAEHVHQLAPTSAKSRDDGTAAAAHHAASAEHAASNFAPAAAANFAAPRKPAEVPPATQQTAERQLPIQLHAASPGEPLAPQAVAREISQSPAGQISQPPQVQTAPHPADPTSQLSAQQVSQPFARQTAVAKQTPQQLSPLPTTRLNKPQSGQEKNSQRQVAEARHKEMKSKVERARQWVHYQDRAHKQKQQKQSMRTPQSTPTLLGQSLPHSAAPQAGLQSSHAGFQSRAMPASMPQLGGAFKMNYGTQHMTQAVQSGMHDVAQSYAAMFNGGQPATASARHYEDHSFWR